MAQLAKNLPAMLETWVQSLGREDPLEKGMAIHSSILTWRISWTGEPGWLPSMGSQIGRDWMTNIYTETKMNYPPQFLWNQPRLIVTPTLLWELLSQHLHRRGPSQPQAYQVTSHLISFLNWKQISDWNGINWTVSSENFALEHRKSLVCFPSACFIYNLGVRHPCYFTMETKKQSVQSREMKGTPSDFSIVPRVELFWDQVISSILGLH